MMPTRRVLQGIPLAGLGLAAALLPGCASRTVEAASRSLAVTIRTTTSSAYAGETVSDRTLALVDRVGLSTTVLQPAIDRFARPLPDVTDADRLLARAELLFYTACRGATAAAPARYLAAAVDALAALQHDCDTPERARLQLAPERGRALAANAHALTAWLHACCQQATDATDLVRILQRDFGITIRDDRSSAWQLADFNRVECADLLEFSGLRHRYRRAGAGVPLVLTREPERGIPKHLTPEAVTRAATAVLRRQADGRLALALHDPRRTATVAVLDGVEAPLAADFTAPFARLLARANLEDLENSSFFRADIADHEGLFLLEDYDPSRQPIVMVHGLWSSPLTWRDLTNDVFGDATLHGDYQVWHYFYATGVPLLENARRLREALIRTRADLDPELDDPASRGIVLIGHSMGGLLSRMVLQRSGDRVWQTLFEARFDDVEPHLEDRDRELARGLYFWEPLPFVDRAVFIAAPLRGSELADSWIGRLGSSLMYVPRRLRALVNRIRDRSGVKVEVPTSVDELSMQHPVMRTVSQLPMRAGLPYHTIMGDVSGSQNDAEWTDGIVPYRSSRLANAESELVVPGAGHDVHFDPRTSAEVRRILRTTARLGGR